MKLRTILFTAFFGCFVVASAQCNDATRQRSCCGNESTDTAAVPDPEAPCCHGQKPCPTDNPVIRTIMERRSVRKYKDTPVPHELLEIIARCGVNAPNGMNSQPWAVRIVESKEWIAGVTAEFVKKNKEMAARDANFKNMFRNAPNVIVIATPKGNGLIDAGLMGENMVLAAQSLGLGTCCLGGPVQFVKNDAAAQPYLAKLNIPEGYEIAYMIAVGYPDEQPAAKERDLNKVEYIR